jgi:hypothetical protein
MLMKDSLIQSLFGTAITDGTNLESAKQRFEMLFGHKSAVFERLFSNIHPAPEPIRSRDDDMDLAMKIARDRRDRLTRSMLSELRQTPDDDARTTERRRQPRRVSQQETSFPDRRQRVRRRVDLELMLKIAREKCESVKRPIFESNQPKPMEVRRTGDRRVLRRQDDSGEGLNLRERRKAMRREEDQEYLETLKLWNAEVPIGFRAYIGDDDVDVDDQD